MTRIREALRHRTRVVSLAAVLTASTIAGCVGDKGVGPSLASPATTLGALHVTPVNAIMAVGDTMTLVVTGQTIAGTPVTAFASVQYVYQSITDSVRLRISPTGLVSALSSTSPSNPVLVNVIGFKNGGVSADQAAIQVVATAFSNPTLSIQPIPPDSAKIPLQSGKWIEPVIANTLGDRVVAPMVRYEYGPGDSTVLQCYTPYFQPTATLSQAQLQLATCGTGYWPYGYLNQIASMRTGTGWVHAYVRVFGVMLHDSVQYTVTNPYTGIVQISTRNQFVDNDYLYRAIIAPGGVVTFTNNIPAVINASVSWIFDDPTAATSATLLPTYGDTTGNIPPITTGQGSTTRRFLRAGEYQWTATVSGGIAPFTGQTVTGTITVQ